ncbi:MAG TPA: CYTH domain-containing protein [Candidatus Aminicenantes bacterium]|nr:CYTH domain-containing protein [Candidatus Aminicenantes bacterium]HRY63819.1 CYTH domain-containing protein [Candidatus Aminicenantes bacterium]HRZ70732.1 CYTH domain-containing protein [Candidatus Aminicenantes bacterium]
MSREIERKFLVKSDAWKAGAKGAVYRQGYLSSIKERVVRVRTIEEKGFLTIKGITQGVSRSEFEYEISVEDANVMLDNMCEKPLIEKKRYKIPVDGLVFEVDEFFGENAGLVVAEVELEDEKQKIDLPDWIGTEVSGDPRYFNSNLIRHPYTKW